MSFYQLSDITSLWQRYDPEAYGFISYKDFWKFSSEMAMIYQVPQDELLDVSKKRMFLKIMDIPIYENQKIQMFGYQFHDVIIKMTAISIFIKH